MSDSAEYGEGTCNQGSSVRAKGKITFTGLKASEGCGDHVEQMRLMQQAAEHNLRPDFGIPNGLYPDNGFGPSLVYMGPSRQAGTKRPNVAIPKDKVALVIGNKEYTHPNLQGLTYPDNDASAMASVLTELGFKVICLTDLTLEEMRTAMIAFSKLVGEGVYAVFYYSGHGCEHQGENYLFPVDIASDLNLSHAIRAQEFLLEMQNKGTLMNLIMVDACRIRVAHQETERRHDVRRLATGNTIFAFACVSQHSAYERSNQQNGEYCRELLKHIRKDLRIEHIFMEVGAAFAMNNNWAQRPNFESDAYMDCRLTSPVSITCNVDSFFLKTKLWLEGQKAPLPTTYKFDSLSLQLTFGSMIHNTLDIYGSLTNLRTSSTIIGVRYVIDTFKPVGIVVEHRDSKSAEMPSSVFKLCRIKSLQKLKESLFMVFEITVSWGDGYLVEEVIKLDVGYPCIAGIFSKFSDWVLEDNPHWTAV